MADTPCSAGESSGTRRLALRLLAGLVGAALLSLPAAYYRIDQVSCRSWPPPHVNEALAGVYLSAVLLLAVCWRGWGWARPQLRTALAAGTLVHAVALLAPPFLSLDPLFYAATGHAMAKYHGSPYVPLRAVLPAADPFLLALSADWQAGTSAYFPGWHELARGIAWLAGDALPLHLKLYQALGLLTMVSTAALVGLAVRTTDARRAGSAAAVVLFCPLSVIEGTLSAHNDHLLALAVALLVLAAAKGRRLAGWAALTGLLVKASALLFVGFSAVAWLASRRRRGTLRLAIVLLLGLVAALRLMPGLVSEAGRFTDLFNPGTIQCERALECFPRWLLWCSRHPTAAFVVGLAFRLAGALWLVYAAVCAGRTGRLLPWLATGIFVYYLYFHAYVQSWYLLPLLPLVPFADARTRPAMCAACVAWICHYALLLPLDCQASATEIWIQRALELLLVIGPPTLLLWRRQRA